MARETKVGLIVACSFLLVVGGVLGYKWYFGDRPPLVLEEPRETGSGDEPPGKEPTRTPKLSGLPPIEAPAPPGFKEFHSEAQRQVSYNETEEAARELVDGLTAAAVEPLRAIGLASLEGLRGLMGFFPHDEKPPALTRRESTSAGAGAPLPPPIDPAPPVLNWEAKPKPERAEAKESTGEEKATTPEEPQPPLPSLENRPRLRDRVREREQPGRQPEPPPSLPFQPTVVEPAGRSQPAQLTEPSSRLPRRAGNNRLPMTFDRTYDPPASLGKPQTERVEPGTPRPPAGDLRNEAASRPIAPAAGNGQQPEQHPPGIPVTLQPLPPEALVPTSRSPRPQAGASSGPGAGEGVRPRMMAQDNWANPQAPASIAPRVEAVTPRVESFDVETHFARQGESYASISLAKYQTEQYQHALAMFNRERDPSLATVQPGRPVRIPPRDYLERHYGRLIPNSGGPASSSSVVPASNLGPPPGARSPRTSAGAGQSGRPDALTPVGPAPAPAARLTPERSRDAVRAEPTGEKQYRVRAEDAGRPAPLYDIARRTLGSGERWGEIARLNKDRLRDVNQLQPGTVLRLPPDARVDAAETPP